jgi:hypothetical protein
VLLPILPERHPYKVYNDLKRSGPSYLPIIFGIMVPDAGHERKYMGLVYLGHSEIAQRITPDVALKVLSIQLNGPG